MDVKGLPTFYGHEDFSDNGTRRKVLAAVCSFSLFFCCVSLVAGKFHSLASAVFFAQFFALFFSVFLQS